MGELDGYASVSCAYLLLPCGQMARASCNPTQYTRTVFNREHESNVARPHEETIGFGEDKRLYGPTIIEFVTRLVATRKP